MRSGRQRFGKELGLTVTTGSVQGEGLKPSKEPVVTPRRFLGLVALSVIGNTVAVCANSRLNSILEESGSRNSKEFGGLGQ